MSTPITIIDRIKTILGGLFLTAFSLAIVVGGIAAVIYSAHQAATYPPVVATIDKVTGGDKASDKVTIAWSFSVDGKKYTGEESADEDEETRFNELRQYQVGQRLTVYYHPHAPAYSLRSLKAEAIGLGISIFGLPFLALALNQLWEGLTGREIVRSRRINAESDPTPGGGLFLVFAATCVVGAGGHFILSAVLDWPWSLVAGLIILLVAIPALNLWAGRVARGWRVAQAAGLRKVHTKRQTARIASRVAAAHGDSGENFQEEPDAEDFLASIGGPGKRLAILGAFTVIWCGFTVAFTWLAVGPLIRHHYAGIRFASTEGVVLSSQVNVSKDEQNSTYAPRIKYRYTVAGQEHIGRRYDFLNMSSNDDSYARRAVRENPPGETITVYYNPNDPSEAILHLEAPGSGYFVLLFLQPFALIGVALVGWCLALPFSYWRAKQFFRATSPPYEIPGWGVLRRESDSWVLQGRRNWLTPLGHFLAGYGLTCFFSVFVVGLFFHGSGDAEPGAVGGAMVVAAGVGTAALLRRLLSPVGTSRVVIDLTNKRILVQSRRRNLDAPLSTIRGLQFREIPYPGSLTINGQRVRYLLLEAVAKGRKSLPLHAFKRQSGREEEVLAVTYKTQLLLAGLIGCPSAEMMIDEQPEATAASSRLAQALGQLAGLLALLRNDSYSDLT